MFRSIRLSLRFILPLAIALSALAYGVVPLVDSLTLRWFVRDLDVRSQLVADTLEEPLADLIARKQRGRILSLFSRAIEDERLFALALCAPDGTMITKTITYPKTLGCEPAKGRADAPSSLVELPEGSLHVAKSVVEQDGATLGHLILVHDMSFVQRRSADSRHYVIALFIVLGVVVALVTVFVAHLSWHGWVAGTRAMLRGEGLIRPFGKVHPELQPIAADLRELLREVHTERRQRDESRTEWGPETLKRLLREELYGDEVLVVANREPYIHVKTPGGIAVQRPASGLVTAVEPVLRACSGTWIAHGAGSADRETADRHGRLQVPPGDPRYTLRRIWLTKEEEQGYYYGFANEGLWPLCHIAHVRPVFRARDWDQYVRVNTRFADTVAEEAKTNDPVVLVQDYHFALLPRLIRERLPRATVITFWHIPWPNPESFGICPWRDELLDGLLGSTILGFHTRYHGKNFLETVDRFLETRIDHEQNTISYNGELTLVESYPISISWPDRETVPARPIAPARAELRRRLGVAPEHRIAVGIDRLDYTKGILERFQAVERLLEKYPEWRGRFSFVQIAAPSRSSLDEYRNLESRVRALAARINQRFGDAQYRPIELVVEHHDAASVFDFYRDADVCVVTSLHDGMNLVAKEFIAARDDELGVLVLSRFTGAARELHEALIVNPYDVEQTADALHRALVMPVAEQRERMRSLRTLVRDFNVYRWAGRMLLDASRLRQRERQSDRILRHQSAQLRRVK